jgi:hypothetical protein
MYISAQFLPEAVIGVRRVVYRARMLISVEVRSLNSMEV